MGDGLGVRVGGVVGEGAWWCCRCSHAHMHVYTHALTRARKYEHLCLLVKLYYFTCYARMLFAFCHLHYSRFMRNLQNWIFKCDGTQLFWLLTKLIRS